MSKPKRPFRIARASTGQYYVKYLTANGEVLAVSEMLNSRDAAVNNIDSMAGVFLQNHPTTEQLERFFLPHVSDINTPSNEWRVKARWLAESFVNEFLTVRDQLHQFIQSEKKPKQ